MPAAEPPRWDSAAVARALVDVRPSKRPTAGADRPAAATPRHRGFIVDGQGYIVTNDPGVSGVKSFEVTLHDGRTLPAALVAEDRLNDIAVLKVEASGLPAIALGESRALAVGERVLLIGAQGGRDRTLTAATVRATGTATGGNLALDLPLRPKGSGGPLLNRLGQAVGIVTDGRARTLTLAIPIDRVKPILRDLLARPAVGFTRESPQGR
jgi:serine protease Do